MNIKTLKNGFSLPEVGLGTWTMGGSLESDNSRDDEWLAALRASLEIGYRHIDTAAMYGNGHAEELVCEVVSDTNRKGLSIATKVFKTHLAYDDFLQSTNDSLNRLGLEYVDLLYIHAPNPEVPIKDTMRAMDELVASGKTKHIAVSNFTVAQLEEAQACTQNKIVANQIQYSLAVREVGEYESCMNIESEIIPYCQQNDILVVAYCPIKRKLLLEPHVTVDEMCQKYGKTRAQIAINWLISQDNIVTIPKTDDLQHLKDNFEASGWYMEQEDVERLRREYTPIS